MTKLPAPRLSTATIRDIQAGVAAHYRVTLLDLLSDRRPRWLTEPRQVGMWIARYATPHSYPEIGREFRRDHTTVMHAVAVVDLARERDGDFRHDTDVLLWRFSPQSTDFSPIATGDNVVRIKAA